MEKSDNGLTARTSRNSQSPLRLYIADITIGKNSPKHQRTDKSPCRTHQQWIDTSQLLW